MSILKELEGLLGKLNKCIEQKPSEVERVVQAAEEVGKSWSGSYLGYHSRVYYKNFVQPPHGIYFSIEYGLDDSSGFFSKVTTGDWIEYQYSEIEEAIERHVKPNWRDIKSRSVYAREVFEKCRDSVLSLLSLGCGKGEFVEKIKKNIEDLRISDYGDFFSSRGQVASRDTTAISEGMKYPPHEKIIAKSQVMISPFECCQRLKEKVSSLAKHMERARQSNYTNAGFGNKIFIGHGRTLIWKDLKDFVVDRLGLPYDEFNRTTPVGQSNISRLSEMLEQSCFAFIVLTAEDEQVDGKLHPRMNVVHEAGLFQGRLGFDRVAILLEKGCREFGNIHGLVQLRFEKGNIGSVFEEARTVLEKHGIIKQELHIAGSQPVVSDNYQRH